MSAKKVAFQGLLSGDFLRQMLLRQIGVVLLGVAIAVVHIANRNGAERAAIEMAHLEKDIKDLKSESMDVASQLMKMTNQAEVARQIETNNLGLSESDVPPNVILERRP